MIDLDDIRQDIFDINTAPKVLYVYRGDTFEVVLDLTISASELNTVVLNCDGLPEALPLTLLESTDTSSKWNLVLTKELTLILTPKNHNFTITIVRTDGTELTLYKGIMVVNNRVHSNYSNNYYVAALLKQTAPTIADNDYLIGTMWVNVLTNRVYFLTSVVNNEAKWLDYSDDKVSEEITAEKVKQLYESNSDTNAFTDAEKAKLAGIESGAEVNTVNPEDLVADNISFDGSGTNFLAGEVDIEGAIKELDTRVKTNADNVALKVDTSDVVDNLTSTDVDKPLSANQGKALKDTVDVLDTRVDDLELETARLDNEIVRVEQEVDAHIEDLDNPHGVTAEQVNTYNKITIDNKDVDTLQAAKDYTDILGADVLELQGKVEVVEGRIEAIEDGTTVVKRAEQDEDGNSIKDTYATVAYVDSKAGVVSVNGKAGVVELDAEDVGALPADTPIPTKLSDLDNDEGFVKESDLETTLLNYVEKETGKGLSTNDYTNADKNKVDSIDQVYTSVEKTKLAGIEAGAEVNKVDSVNGKVGTVVIDAGDISFDGSGTNYLADKSLVENAVKELDVQVKVLQDTKEAIANKAIDFSVVDDMKYPTTKAVKDLIDAIPSGEVDLNEMSYFNYAGSIYADKYSLLPNAWESSLTVDPSEISAKGSTSRQRGKAQYPNGETEGVIIPQGVTSIGMYAFYNWSSNNQPLVIPNSVTEIGEHAFYNWQSNTHPLVIPNSVTSIGYGAFGRWTSNTYPLVIPESVTSIIDNTFRDWSSNNQPLVIPNGVTSIGDEAFAGWLANNQPLVIPNSVTSISWGAFLSWQSNTHPLVIPNSVTSIDANAFANWPSVPYIEIQATTPPTLSNANAFAYQNDAPIYVPDESVDDYKTAENWEYLADRIFPISDKDNTYTKSEIDLMIGDIDSILDNILGV